MNSQKHRKKISNQSLGYTRYQKKMNGDQIEDFSYQNIDFLNKESISKFLHCPKCNQIFNNPKRLLLCGDTFCEQCLNANQSKSRGRKQKQCPTCNQVYNEEHIQDDLTAKKIIEDLKVQCKRTQECQWIGILAEHRMHIQNKECLKYEEKQKPSVQKNEVIFE